MNKTKFWDEYEIKARFIPTFLSVAPLVHFLILFLGEAFWKELIGNIGWMLIVADLSLSLIVMLALVQVQCGFAKHWVEESVFGKGGVRFPTTDMLLYNGGLISFERKEQIRNRITEQFSVKLSSRDEEKNKPDNARLQAREAVGHVRSTVGKGAMTFQYNIRYGFFRNLFGGVIWGAVGSLGCSVIYGINNNWKIMSLFIVFFVIYLIMFFFKKMLLEKFAFTYADTLFNEFLNLN